MNANSSYISERKLYLPNSAKYSVHPDTLLKENGIIFPRAWRLPAVNEWHPDSGFPPPERRDPNTVKAPLKVAEQSPTTRVIEFMDNLLTYLHSLSFTHPPNATNTWSNTVPVCFSGFHSAIFLLIWESHGKR